MASEKQIAANRANAKKSTGPKTAAGQLKSSRNALRHGFPSPCTSTWKPRQRPTPSRARWHMTRPTRNA